MCVCVCVTNYLHYLYFCSSFSAYQKLVVYYLFIIFFVIQLRNIFSLTRWIDSRVCCKLAHSQCVCNSCLAEEKNIYANGYVKMRTATKKSTMKELFKFLSLWKANSTCKIINIIFIISQFIITQYIWRILLAIRLNYSSIHLSLCLNGPRDRVQSQVESHQRFKNGTWCLLA